MTETQYHTLDQTENAYLLTPEPSYPGGYIRPHVLTSTPNPSFPTHTELANMQSILELKTSQTTKVTGNLTLKPVLSEPNFGNDYSGGYVKSGVLPQSWVRNVEDPLVGYPRLRKLHNLKAEHNAKHAKLPISMRAPESQIPKVINDFGAKDMQFDVIMVHGCYDSFDYESLKALNIGKISVRPSLLYLWVPSTKISEGRKLMEQWGYRHGEDIAFLINSLDSVYAPQVSSWGAEQPVFRPTTWHCLMGLKGTLRRSTDTNLINCNVNTDVIIQSGDDKNAVPDEFYKLVDNFTSMARKLHVLPKRVPESIHVRPRPGWVVVSPDTFTMGTINPKDFKRRRTIPVDAEIDALRPQTPPPPSTK